MILDRYAIKDVTMLQLGTQSEAEIGLRRGIVDGAMVSPPQSFLLIRDGFRELVSSQDYGKFSSKLISGGVAARRSWAVKNRDTVLRVIKGVVEGVKIMTAQESLAKRTLAKYTRQNQPDILDRLYKFATDSFGRDPAMPRDAVANMARLMGEFGLVDKTQAANTPPEAYYDNSYVDELKQSGFLKELWK